MDIPRVFWTRRGGRGGARTSSEVAVVGAVGRRVHIGKARTPLLLSPPHVISCLPLLFFGPPSPRTPLHNIFIPSVINVCAIGQVSWSTAPSGLTSRRPTGHVFFLFESGIARLHAPNWCKAELTTMYPAECDPQAEQAPRADDCRNGTCRAHPMTPFLPHPVIIPEDRQPDGSSTGAAL